MMRSDQRGSVLSFVIIGVALVAALIGGILAFRYFVQQSSGANETVVQEDESTVEVGEEVSDLSTDEKEEANKNEKSVIEKEEESSGDRNHALELPETGIDNNYTKLFVVFMIGFLVFSYIQSRRFCQQR